MVNVMVLRADANQNAAKGSEDRKFHEAVDMKTLLFQRHVGGAANQTSGHSVAVSRELAGTWTSLSKWDVQSRLPPEPARKSSQRRNKVLDGRQFHA